MEFNLSQAFDQAGYVQTDALVRELPIPKREFASAIGLSSDAVIKKRRLHTTATQSRLRETVEILNRIVPWAGSFSAAWSWFRSQPIPALGDVAAEELISRGQADEVRAYLTHISEGGATRRGLI